MINNYDRFIKIKRDLIVFDEDGERWESWWCIEDKGCMKRYPVKDEKIADSLLELLNVLSLPLFSDREFKRLNNENIELKGVINVLEDEIEKLRDDFTAYHKNLEEINRENPRFKRTNCSEEIKDTWFNHYYWMLLEENIDGMVNLLNKLNDENIELKKKVESMSKGVM